MLDEAHQLRVNLASFLSLSRKANVNVCTLWQDIEQIHNTFNKEAAANILSNSNLKIFMPCAKSIEVCSMLSKLCGQFQFQETNQSALQTKYLLSPQQIFQLDTMLVLHSNNKPVLLSPVPFYENKKLLELTKLPPYKPLNKALCNPLIIKL